MTTSRHPWYWAWRGWRVSTWAFLLWSALIWPDIVSLVRSDEDKFVSGVVAHALIIVWILGVVIIAVARLLSYAWHRRREAARDTTSEAPEQLRRGRAGAAVRTVLPFLAALLLAGLVIGPPIWGWATRSSDIETAVEADWPGEKQFLWVHEVSCEETEASWNGARIHVCEIRHCAGAPATYVPLECPETTSIACAALVNDRLVMISPTWPLDRARELARNGDGQCPG